MAKRFVYVDDLDGKSEAEGTTSFSLNGEDYEIDLSVAHAGQLENALAKYIEKARKPERTSAAPARRRRSGGQPATADKEQTKAIREWARSNGWPNLGDRGRVPTEAIEKYHANVAS